MKYMFVSITASIFACTAACAAGEHPTIEHAIASLEQTKSELETGEHGLEAIAQKRLKKLKRL